MEVPVALALLAILVSAVNIKGGFVIFQRMLTLFKRKGDKDFSSTFFIPGLLLVSAALYARFGRHG